MKSKDKNVLLDNKDKNILKKILKRFIFLQYLNESCYDKIIENCQKSFYRSGDIIDTNSKKGVVFIIRNGTYDSLLRINDKLIRIKRNKIGDCLGFDEILSENGHNLTTFTVKDGCMFEIEKSILKAFIDDKSSIAYRIDNFPYFQYLNLEQKKYLCNNVQLKYYDENETITEQNTIVFNVYFIIEGEVEIIKNDNIVNILCKGDFFGEHSVFGSNKISSSQYSVNTKKCTMLLCFNNDVIKKSQWLLDWMKVKIKDMNKRPVQLNFSWCISQIPTAVVLLTTNSKSKKLTGDRFELSMLKQIETAAYSSRTSISDDDLDSILCLKHKDKNSLSILDTSYVEDEFYDPNEILLSLIVNQFIGSGRFSNIFSVLDNDSIIGTNYALKIVKINQTSLRQNPLLYKENVISKCIMNNFCIRQFATFYDVDNIYMLMDKMICDISKLNPDYTCTKLIKKSWFRYTLQNFKYFCESKLKFYAACILLGLEYLHSENIIYRDLKPQNVLIDGTGYAKLSDFGFSKYMDSDRCYTCCGTPGFMPPEIIFGNGYGKEVDLWSFGSTIYYLATSYNPFDVPCTKSHVKIIKRAISIDYELYYPDYLSNYLIDLIKKLLHKDKRKRLKDINTIKCHKWFEDIDWESMKTKEIIPPKFETFKSIPDNNNKNSYFSNF